MYLVVKNIVQFFQNVIPLVMPCSPCKKMKIVVQPCLQTCRSNSSHLSSTWSNLLRTHSSFDVMDE